MIGLAVLMQAGTMVITPAAPTVGDTITIVRTLAAPAEARGRAQPLGSSLLVEPLAEPSVGRNSQGLVIRYTLAMFEAGRHPVAVPPVELVYRDGRVELVPADTAYVSVRSVLSAADTLREPASSLAPVPRYPTRTWPLFAIIGAVTLGATGWGLVRRRTRPRAEVEVSAVGSVRPPLMQWAAAGESRAVASLAADRLRARLAKAAPDLDRALSTGEIISTLEAKHSDWPIRDLADTLRGLDRARFAPATPTDIAILVDQVDAVLAVLPRGA